MPDYIGKDPNEEWADLNKGQSIQPLAQLGEVKMPMNWPQAITSMVTVVSISAVLIVLFMVLWGPW